MKFNKQTVLMLIAFVMLPSSVLAAPQLPANIEWLTNDTDKVFSSPKATKGGTLKSFLLSFPLTLRYVGPDANGGFRSAILGNKMSLVASHPNTSNLFPSLATHWAYSDDNTTMYFKLNPDVRWSDGKKVTPEDYAFTLEFMRMKDIVAPWYNTYYNDEIGEVVIYDDHTISVSSAKPRPRNELYSHVSINPTPRHFYKDMNGFVKKYNWKIAPNTGPYQISKIKKGKSITFERKKNWWAQDLKYYKNRFNVDKVKYTVIRDINLAWEHFKKGKLDAFGLTLPLYWHEKAKGEIFDNGYVNKLWFYSDPQKYAFGIWLNQDNPILKDRNVRLGIAHSMNIEKVNKQVLRGDYSRKNSYSSGHSEFTDRSIKARKFDLKKADEYFNLAGWSERGGDGIRVKDGKRLSVSVTYGSDSHTPRLVVLKEEFKRAGLELILRKMDGAASFKSALEKKHDIWWGALGGGDFPQYWGTKHSTNAHKAQTNNFTNTDDPEMDKLIEAFRSAMSTEDRISLSRKLENLIHHHSAWIPTLEVPYSRIGYWRWLKLPDVPGTKIGGPATAAFDFGSSFNTSDGGMFWIDTKLKKEVLKAKKKGKKYDPVLTVDKTYKISD
ncbi:MAG: ABC transporter substrate-binding protein [Gammaproteobacteria bacterium]|nr:ABC transporter substrate-binding protein [Gammaproteobacteria bacterium]